MTETFIYIFFQQEDWRARVRGLERIASALRQPSALKIIEPRLGSLLHDLLGGERSCRVAAAGLAVAKVCILDCQLFPKLFDFFILFYRLRFLDIYLKN